MKKYLFLILLTFSYCKFNLRNGLPDTNEEEIKSPHKCLDIPLKNELNSRIAKYPKEKDYSSKNVNKDESISPISTLKDNKHNIKCSSSKQSTEFNGPIVTKDKSPIKKQLAKKNKKRFILYFIRHGEAEHNVIKYRSKQYKWFKRQINKLKGWYERKDLRDPNLSEEGKLESAFVGKKFKEKLKDQKIDLVLTSCFCRAIETGLIMFPSHKEIYPMLGLNESTLNKKFKKLSQKTKMNLELPENKISKSINDQISKIEKKYIKRINYEFVEGKRRNKIREFKEDAFKSDMKIFFSSLESNELQKLKNKIKDYENKEIIRIAIVGHSHLFKDYFKTKDKLLNNGIIEVEYKENEYHKLIQKTKIYSLLKGNYIIYKGVDIKKKWKDKKRI